MNPELEKAIRERIDLGHSEEEIKNELRQAGYDDETIAAVYGAVSSSSAATPVPGAPLPRATHIFGRAWSFMTGRLDLVLLLAAPTLVANVASIGIELGWFPLSIGTGIALGVGFLLVLIIQFLLQLTLAHTALGAVRQSAPTVSTSWSWAVAHIWSWIWIATITFCVVFGASLLLLIPGLIVSVYLMFALYVFVDGPDTRGLAALQQSFALIYGNFWALVGRLLVFVLFMIGIGIVFGIIVALLATVGVTLGEGSIAILTTVLDGLLTGVATVLGVFFMATLYDEIKQRSHTDQAPNPWWLPWFGWLGVGVFALTAFAIGAFLAQTDRDSWETMLQDIDTATLPSGLEENLTPEEQAEFEAFMEQYGEELGAGAAPPAN